MIPMNNMESYFEDDYYRFDFMTEDDTPLATIEFDYIDDEGSGKLFCELSATCHVGMSGNEPLLAFDRVNLIIPRWVKEKVNTLGDVGSLNWGEGLDRARKAAIVRYRANSSAGGYLAPLDGDNPDAPDMFLLEPFILDHSTTLIYGDKGSAKSMLGLWFGVIVAKGIEFFGHKPTRTGPVLYIDFEDDALPHQYRLGAIGNALGIEPSEMKDLIYHEKVSGRLKDSVRKIRRIVRDHDIVMVVVDSVGLARAGDVSASDVTIKLFKALGQLDAPVLAIDHVTKNDAKQISTGDMDARKASPIGSQFTESSARMSWFVDRLPEQNAGEMRLNAYNKKHNHTPQHLPIGIQLDIEWSDRMLPTSIEFTAYKSSFDKAVTALVKFTNQERLLLWHYQQQREDGHVIPMTLTDMRKSGIPYGTITSTVTKKRAHWWERVSGAKQYILTPEGMERATFISAFTPTITPGGGE